MKHEKTLRLEHKLQIYYSIVNGGCSIVKDILRRNNKKHESEFRTPRCSVLAKKESLSDDDEAAGIR